MYKFNFDLKTYSVLISASPSPSIEDVVSSVCLLEEDEHRARAIGGAMGFEASSIMTGHFWA